MSLRVFHIAFVAISTLMCLGVAFWGLGMAPGASYSGASLMGGLGLAGAAALVCYGVWAFRKLWTL